jgi:hypothetical protein
MKWSKESLIGLLMLASLFIGVGFLLPFAMTVGIIEGSFSTKVFSWVVIGVLLLIAIFTIPELMFVWFGIPILAIVFAWIFLGDSSGNCVPIVPGSCE